MGKSQWVDSACADSPGFLVSWVLLVPRLPTSSRSPSLRPRTSICPLGLVDIWLDLLPKAPPPPVQKGDAQHKNLHTDAKAKSGNLSLFPSIWTLFSLISLIVKSQLERGLDAESFREVQYDCASQQPSCSNTPLPLLNLQVVKWHSSS